MAGKKIFKKIDVKTTDTDFTALFSRYKSKQAGKEEISQFIRHRYFPIAYFYAATILSKDGRYSDFENDTAELAVEAMEDILADASAGKLKFKGKSAFSTFLYKIILNKHREGRKLYYPAEVKRKGMPAIDAYRLLLIEGYGAIEISSILEQEYGLHWESSYPLIALAESYREDEAERHRKRKNSADDISYDAMIEAGAPIEGIGIPEAPGLPGRNQPSPEEELIGREVVAIVTKIIEQLPEPARTVLIGYELEGRWETIKEMQAELGLKNGSYELGKARDILRNLMK